MDGITRLFKGNHTLLMVVCCVVPMALLAAIFLFNVPISTIGLFAVVLLCPLMHLFMMRSMGHGHQQAGCHDDARTDEPGARADNSQPRYLPSNEMNRDQQVVGIKEDR